MQGLVTNNSSHSSQIFEWPILSQIKAKNTKPEMLVRKFLRVRGFRYKLHDKTLPGKPVTVVLQHKDGSKNEIAVNHTYNEPQIEWFKAGGVLNVIRSQFAMSYS
jgi:aconitase A